DGGLYLGPVTSTRTAQLVIDAVECVLPLRRCRAPLRLGQVTRDAPCAPAQLGAALCPCSGGEDASRYGAVADVVRRGFTREPDLLMDPLRERIAALAHAERFEEAADVRDRMAALSATLVRQRRTEML